MEKKQTGAENVVWDLTVLYKDLDDPNIQKDMTHYLEQAEAFANEYRGKVGELDPEELYEAMDRIEKIYDGAGRVASFAFLNYSTDTADPKLGALVQKATEFDANLDQKLLFFMLEWNLLPDDHTKKMIVNPTLAKYAHHLEAERRYKPYQLSEPEERILSEKSVTGNSAWTRFFTQLVSAMRYDFDGQQLNQTQLMTRLYSPDRETRKKAADSLTVGLNSKKMELTYIYNTVIADKASNDKLRGYPTWISSRNLSNKAPDAVVDALIGAVTSNYELVARHYRLKRALLGVDQLMDYDRYAPLPFDDIEEETYTWSQAKEIILNAFNAFSPNMAEVASYFFDKNWIHAAVLPNKRGGAYASPVTPSAHPYVFVNFEGRARDVATLAHELGHGIHMYLSGKANGLYGLYTPLTTAEMASVFGEMLVFSDLMRRETRPKAKLAMLAGKIEDTFATVFRQISMNRFEHGFHTTRRTEGELPTERINAIWMETQQAMFGDSVNLREEYSQWWSYIPHFLNTPGYVYAYAFGELLVLALYQLYQEQGAPFAPKYLDVLAAGNSDYPDKILATVGVDLNDPNFWQKGLDAISTLIDQEEALAKEAYPDRF